jgi:hypothetical protein
MDYEDSYNDGWDFDDYSEDETQDETYYDDSMDGDHESAFRSAGWGTDEDYYQNDSPLEDDYC